MIRFNISIYLGVLIVVFSGCARLPRHGVTMPTPDASIGSGRGISIPYSFMWPVRGEVISNLDRQSAGLRNKGVDILVKADAEVRSAADGTVAFVSQSFKGLGKTLLIEHDNGFQTVYGYNSEIFVKEGERIKKGDLIARAGSSGRSSRRALHFEIRREGRATDPIEYLPRR